jgi:hypothetical protein
MDKTVAISTERHTIALRILATVFPGDDAVNVPHGINQIFTNATATCSVFKLLFVDPFSPVQHTYSVGMNTSLPSHDKVRYSRQVLWDLT